MTPLTIDRGRRDALVELMMYRIIVIGDQRLDRDRNRGIGDEVIASQFGDDGALMVDLGWLDRWWLTRLDLPEARKELFEIRVAHERLRGTLERALDDALALDAAAIGARPSVLTHDFGLAAQTCRELLAELDRMEEAR
jgi:hypothetical protein